MNWLANLVTERPKLVIAVFSLITAICVIGALNVKVLFTIRALYDYPGNPLVKVQDRYFEDFGDDIGFVTAIIETKDTVFTPQVLRFIQDVSRKLKRKPIYRRIWSLSVNQIPRGRGNEVITGSLFERVPDDPAKIRQIRDIALKSRLAVPRLVSKDGRFALVAAELKSPTSELTTDEQEQAIKTMDEVLASTPKPAGVELTTGGSPLIETQIRNLMVWEQVTFGSVALVIITIVLLLAFGSFHGVLLTYAEVVVTVIWVLGFMGFTGIEINMFSNTAPTILMIYGLLDSLFIVAVFYKVFDEVEDRKKAAKITIQKMGWPCLVTSITTAIGFGGFMLTKLPLMQRFGVSLAIGVLIAFLSSIVWMPALLCVLPGPRHGYKKRRFFKLISGVLVRVGRFTQRRRWPIFAAAMVVFVAAGVVASKGRISVMYLKELPQHTEAMKGINLLGEHLLGAISTCLTVDGKPDSMLEPKVIKALDELDQWAEKQRIVKSSLSPSDLVRELHRAFNGGDPAYDKVPDDRGLIAQYLAMLDPHTRSDFITDDYGRTHLRIITLDVGSWEWRRSLFKPLLARAKKLLSDYKIEITGYGRPAFVGQEELVVQLLRGFVVGFTAIAILLGITFRSARLAALAVLPNLVPTVVCLATLTALGVTLRGPTTLFLCVAVGITFDNTIHLFTSIKDARRRGLGHEDSITDALATVGPPIIYTSLLIAGGFGVFLLSDFEMLKGFGATCVGVVIVATFADLFLTVALVRLGGKRPLAPREQKQG